jgi:hypothetical protein
MIGPIPELTVPGPFTPPRHILHTGDLRVRHPVGQPRQIPSRLGSPPCCTRAGASSTPFKPYLDQHADGARGSIRRLFQEIKALGYDGSYPVVADYLSRNSPAREPIESATNRFTGARTP